MRSILDDVEHWHAGACEFRALAGRCRDAEAARIMLSIAAGFAAMARHAEQRLAGREPCESKPAERPLRWASYRDEED